MLRTRFGIAALVLAAGVACPAMAQSEKDREDSPATIRRPDGAEGARGGRMGAIIGRLPEELGMDDAQKAQFDEIVGKHREAMAADGQRMQKMRTLMQQMREARQAGDVGKIEELRGQLRELRGGDEAQPAIMQVIDEVEGILRPEQLEKFSEMRERFEGMRGGDPAGRMEATIERLRDDLKLDAQQQGQFDKLTDTLRTQMEAQRGQWEQMRPLFREMREAEQNGDEGKAQEIRGQIQSMRQSGQQSFEDFYNSLDGILRDDQKATLAQYRERYQAGGRDARGGDATDVRTIIRAARRLELSDEQKQQLEQITREAGKAGRDTAREARATLAEGVKQQIMQILTAEQQAEFQKLVAGGGKGGRGGEGGKGRGPRGAGADKADEAK